MFHHSAMKSKLRRTSAIALLCSFIVLFMCILAPPRAYSGNVDFIVPGVSLDSISFDVGARVTYLIISQAYGTSDSSVVDLAVLDSTDSGILLEVVLSPYPGSKEETVTARLLLYGEIKKISSSDEIHSCIKEILVKEGTAPFRKPSAEEIEDFDLEKIFLSSNQGRTRNKLPAERVETPAGDFICEVDEISKGTVRPVKLGGIDAERELKERTVLWISDEVPFWGLVRSRVETTTSTRILKGAQLVNWKPRTTVTESVLISYKIKSY
ncbi:MAG: hypothetical protein KAX38_07795 [Candidatus Krumholzibacteria bacterium]|nr:hypothetical protein [Candidatus Krumholzibacteria bacterium]